MTNYVYKENEDRALFKFRTVGPREPMVNDPFFWWLTRNYAPNSRKTHIDYIDAYMSEMGWDIDRHIIDGDQLDTLQNVLSFYADVYMPDLSPFTKDDLFVPASNDDQGAFFVWDKDSKQNESKKNTSPVLARLLNQHFKNRVIMDINSENFFFEIAAGHLFLKYQTIIGGRRICRVVN